MDLVVSGILNFLTEQEAIGKADEVQDFYRYGIEITISSMLNIVLVLLMGALTGHLLESVIYLAVFIAVRVITGGYHADTYFRCNLLMCSTFIATAFLNDKVCGYVNIWVIAAFVVFEEIIAFVFCPVENKNKPIEKEKKPKFKAMGMIVFLLLDLFGGAIINRYQMVGSMILLTNLLIAVLIISAKIKEKRCNKNEIILVDFCLCVLANAAFSLHAASATLGIGVFDHIPAAPAMGNHDEFLAAGNLALFGVGIVGFDDEFLHRLGRAADVEGILIDTAEAGAVPVPAVIMDMALHRNGIVADGTSEHIDSAAAYRVKASVKHKGMREYALLGAGSHIMRFVFACFKQARELVTVALRVAAHDTVMGIPMLIDPSDLVFRRFLAVFCEALISTPTLKSGNRPYSMNIK